MFPSRFPKFSLFSGPLPHYLSITKIQKNPTLTTANKQISYVSFPKLLVAQKTAFNAVSGRDSQRCTLRVMKKRISSLEPCRIKTMRLVQTLSSMMMAQSEKFKESWRNEKQNAKGMISERDWMKKHYDVKEHNEF